MKRYCKPYYKKYKDLVKVAVSNALKRATMKKAYWDKKLVEANHD